MENYQTDQSFQKQYEKYVKQVTPTHNLALQMLHAFVDGRCNLHGRTDYFERCKVKRIGRCGSRKRVRDSACSGERTSDRL